MSDDGTPTINVTRGKRSERQNKKKRGQSSGAELPGAMEVASGLARRARRLWLAGLGALSMAEEIGTQAFDALVEEGKSWEQARREQTKETAERVEQLTKEGTRAVEAVEERVRDEVNEALHRIGVPHRDDVDDLRNRIDALSDRLDQLADAIESDSDS